MRLINFYSPDLNLFYCINLIIWLKSRLSYISIMHSKRECDSVFVESYSWIIYYKGFIF